MSKNRREYTRYPAVNLVSYVHYDKEEHKDYEGVAKTADVSKGGFRVQIPEKFEVDTKLEVTVAIGEKILSFLSKVVFVKKLNEKLYDVGVQIVSAKDGDFETFLDYLEKLSE